ncbi:hypothetical protein D3C80_1980890 [compost metagenome]
MIVPDGTKDLRYSEPNNINAYNLEGRLSWNISKLLKIYSDERGHKHYEDLYFDIRPLDNERLFCVGFINHCEIDLKTEKIIKLINNR